MKLSIKYWMHHKKRALTIFFAIMVSTAAMTVGVFIARSASQGNVEKVLNATGDYDLVTTLIEEEQLSILQGNEKDIATYGVILNGGVCKTQYCDPVSFGAFNDETARELFHYAPEKGGSYPEAPGEICGYRSTFQNLGVAPVVGNILVLELYDTQGLFIGDRVFTITGILNEADSHYGDIRSLSGSYTFGGSDFSEEDTDFPELFVYSGDIPDSHTLTAMIRCNADTDPFYSGQDCAARKLMDDGIDTWVPLQARLDMLNWLAGMSCKTENELYSKAYLSYNDFYSSILIPVFLVIVLIVSFISVYVVMADAIKERLKQFGLYRSMGMSLREVRRRLIAEAFFFDIAGVAAGYAIGTVLYGSYLWIVNAVSNVRVFSAFNAHMIARAVSMNPYLYPWLLGFIFSALALTVPMLRVMRLSPNEMISPEKMTLPSDRKKHGTYGRILPKATGRKLSGNKSVSILIIIIGWTFVFGAAFMMGKADSDNEQLYMQLDVTEGINADYAAQKDIYNTMCGNVQFNRHNEGISAEDMSALAESGDVASAGGVIELPGLKILCNGGNMTEFQKETLSPLDIENNQTDDFLQELFDKSRYAQGYTEEDILYRLPSVAVDYDFMESLTPYVISGKLDMEGLAEGRKIVIVEYPNGELSNPFSVGDVLSLTDTVIDDPYIEAWDFSHNVMPEGYEPTFYYDYADKSATGLAGYSFGNKLVFESEICAVLRIDDEALQNLLSSESYVFNSTHTGYLSPEFGILCVSDALPVWGLHDRCYTDVYINLKPDADIDRFEILWYSIIGKSGDVDSMSRIDIKQRIARTDRANLILFASMIMLVIFAGCFGMVNTYHFAVNRNLRNLQILRAVGINKKALAFHHIRALFRCPLLAVVTSLLPITLFDLVRRYAVYYAFTLGHNSSILSENGKWIQNWSMRFPWYIELWEQPIGIIMLTAFLCITLLNIAAAITPLKQMYEASIIDGIRKDDF